MSDLLTMLTERPELAALLAILLSPHFALLARYVVKLTPATWDDVGLEWLLQLLKAFAGIVPPDKS